MLAFVTASIALVFLALLFIVPSLLKKSHLQSDSFDAYNTQIARDQLRELKLDLQNGLMSQDDFEVARQELETNLALDLSVSNQDQQVGEKSAIPAALFLLVAIPVFSVLIYLQLGQPQAIDHQQVQQLAEDKAPAMSMEQAVVKLEQRLQSEPENAEGWFMLARTYMTMNRYSDAVGAFEKTIELVGEEANLLIRYADALAMTNQGELQGKPREAIEKALQLDPENQQALWFAGIAAMEASEHKLALERFLILQPMLMSSPENLQQLHNLIARVEKNLTDDEIEDVASQMPAPQAATSTAEIQVSVSLDEAIKDQVSASDVVFVYAKAMNGPPMPLAAAKQSVADLPFTVKLNDAMAMMPSMKLSAFDAVIVGAKISKSGSAGSLAGDLYGEVSGVEVKAGQKISLVIDKIKS
ncbi:MAG: c-type cytochrome biogenesis protein CcmI [Gammaproteobacteria bacterium]|nr:c-type cytochrome biogenesis protein CcmI [Gammaproteobacteria bacterium]